MDRKKAVVTGVSSFIGMHLAQTLAQQSYRVVGTFSRDALEYDSLHKARFDVLSSAGVVLRKLDLTKVESIRELINNELPKIWVHHAGWAEHYTSLDYDLVRAHEVNVRPLSNLYGMLKECECHGVIVTGSSAEYSNSSTACKEDDLCWPTTPYGLSKLSESIRARQLAIQHNLSTRVVRVFIPFGPIDSSQKLIPSTVVALKEKRPINLSPCEQKRDFIFIEDLIRGYLAVIQDLYREEIFDIFNICSGIALPLKKLLNKLANLLQADPALLNFGKFSMRHGEPDISYGSNKKAEQILGWRPNSLEEGLISYLKTLEK